MNDNDDDNDDPIDPITKKQIEADLDAGLDQLLRADAERAWFFDAPGEPLTVGEKVWTYLWDFNCFAEAEVTWVAQEGHCAQIRVCDPKGPHGAVGYVDFDEGRGTYGGALYGPEATIWGWAADVRTKRLAVRP